MGEEEEPEEDEEEMEVSSLLLPLAGSSHSTWLSLVAQLAITISWLVVARSQRSKHVKIRNGYNAVSCV